MPKGKTLQETPKKKFRLSFRKRPKISQVLSEPKIRFDFSHSNLHEHTKHLAVLVENEINYGLNKAEFTQPLTPTWDSLVGMHDIFDMHKTHIKEIFNIKKINIHELDAIAKCVYTALKPVKSQEK